MSESNSPRPSTEQKRKLTDELKGNLKAQLDREGKQSSHREIEQRVNRIAERTDRERGW
ncbi:hypothetical protein EP7_004332 [Isosphaeraceae bacterium EP7]